MGLDLDFSKLDERDVLDIAVQVEEEAEDNYEQLASWTEADGTAETADFFRRMAGLERRHREQLISRRNELFPDAPERQTRRGVWEVEQPDWDAIGPGLTLEAAFDLAMEAERQAGEYYGSAIEFAHEPRVQELFEVLRRAEEEHLRMLLEQRRRMLPSSP
jgi:rubrerythrin